MADSLTKEQRSRNMAAIKGINTKPEITVRKFLFAAGLRYRLHRKDLPGRPDIVLSGLKTVVFVNGCYWHRHNNCKLSYTPKSNQEFWQNKFQGNIDRDQINYRKLTEAGWKIIVVWECQVKDRTFELWILDSIKK